MSLLIGLGIYLLGVVLTIILTAFWEVDRQGNRDDEPGSVIFGLSIMWPFVLAFGLPVLGIVFVREKIIEHLIAKRKARQQSEEAKLRVDTNQSLPPAVKVEDVDYRTMPCHSCGHSVEKSS